MKSLMRTFGKALFIILYPILVVVLIVLLVALIQQVNINKEAYAEYEELYTEFELQAGKKADAQQGIAQIGEYTKALKDAFDQSKDRIAELEDQVETEQKDGYGEVKGSILPFVTAGAGFNQYQRVCAESVANTNIQYCVSVSAIQKDYILVVPEGEYNIFATIQSDIVDSGRAYYTKFVECTKGAEGEKCSESLSQEKIKITVESGGVVENIDPADWSGIDFDEAE